MSYETYLLDLLLEPQLNIMERMTIKLAPQPRRECCPWCF